jgi:hypothetical protein
MSAMKFHVGDRVEDKKSHERGRVTFVYSPGRPAPSEGCRSARKGGSRQRNMLWIISLLIAATKTCSIRSTMFRSRDVASRASTAIAGEGSGISEVFSLPWHRIVIAI